MSDETTQAEFMGDSKPSSPLLVALAWLIVAIPLAYGLWQTLVKAGQLLGG